MATTATRSAARGLNTLLLVLWTKSSIQEHDDAVTPVVVA